MEPFRHLAVGIDLSNDSGVAGRWAGALARRLGAGVTMISVDELADVDTHGSEEIAHAVQARRAGIDEQLANFEERFFGGVEVRTEVIEGEAAEGLLGGAESAGADLVVVGTHGMTGLRRFLLGSVAEEVATTCQTSVLLARRAPGFRRILCAIDLEPGCERLVAAAVSLLDSDGELELMHAWDLPLGIEQLYRRVDRSARSALSRGIEDRLADLAAAEAATGVRVVTNQVNRRARVAVLARLEEEAFDLALVGGRTTGIGSTARAIVRHAPCAVLVVR